MAFAGIEIVQAAEIEGEGRGEEEKNGEKGEKETEIEVHGGGVMRLGDGREYGMDGGIGGLGIMEEMINGWGKWGFGDIWGKWVRMGCIGGSNGVGTLVEM